MVKLRARRAFELGGVRIERGDSIRTDDPALVFWLLYRCHGYLDGRPARYHFSRMEAALVAGSVSVVNESPPASTASCDAA